MKFSKKVLSNHKTFNNANVIAVKIMLVCTIGASVNRNIKMLMHVVVSVLLEYFTDTCTIAHSNVVMVQRVDCLPKQTLHLLVSH